MRALRYYGIEDIRLEDIPEPECRPGCVKLKPNYVGICGSDMCVSPVNLPRICKLINPIRRPAIFTTMKP
jgi:D-arabinose 1-dehydrogenase-like Zn-dependent alcohol dehydrogenase